MQARKFANAMHAPLIFTSASHSINVQKMFKVVLSKVFDLRCNLDQVSDYGAAHDFVLSDPIHLRTARMSVTAHITARLKRSGSRCCCSLRQLQLLQQPLLLLLPHNSKHRHSRSRDNRSHRHRQHNQPQHSSLTVQDTAR